MPYYRTHVLQDAWIHHNAVVEADSPKEAAHMAYRAWRGDDNGVVLEEGDAQGFDDAQEIDPEDVEEITKEEYLAELEDKPEAKLTWDYAIGQESIRIEAVKDDEVVSLVAELPIGTDAVAEAICNAHNAAFR